MEQFIVSARKYRPQTFEDVVGQQAITNTLENAIKNNHLAQALLFTGPRGVGKTSCARILAKRINEESNTGEDEDFAFNIFELDAASNNSVDDIRNLTDQVRIPPQVGKFKVYIIDEVHMLSQAAFNAFLKTLEEPPAHAIFILATTEKHKIIPTILSRCQIFDFKRIGVLDAKNYLKKIAKNEGITADDDGLHIIAQKADGAMRDALSIFDRVVSFSGKNLTREAVTENLNVLDYDEYFKITDLLLANDIPGVLIQFNSILARGFDGHHFISGLASHFRDLLVAKDKVTIDLLEVGDNAKKRYLEQSQKCDMRFLLQAIDLANDCDLKYKASKNQRLLVELTLMQLASITFDGEKKNSKPYIIAAVHFREKVRKRPTPKYEPKKEVAKAPEKAFNPEEVKPTAPAKPVSLKTPTRRRTSALSLKSLTEKKELEKIEVIEAEDLSKKPKKPFTQTELEYQWKSYAKKVESEGQKSLGALLVGSKPKVDKDFNIHFEMYSNQSQSSFNKGKVELLGYLKQNLNNYHIEIFTTVNEEELLRKAYTPHEKFEQMSKKNKNLELLKRKFNLEL